MEKKGTIAFITTPNYRKQKEHLLQEFVLLYMGQLCKWFKVLSTGSTYKEVVKIINQSNRNILERVQQIARRYPIEPPIKNIDEIDLWRNTIMEGLHEKLTLIQGMVEIGLELVEGRLDAIIHLTHFADYFGKPDSMMVRREANVHEVPIASDINTAQAMIADWMKTIEERPNDPLFITKGALGESPLKGLTPDDKVLALIAHDQKKLEMCCFVIEHFEKIFDEFDYILTTGTTGKWVKEFALAAGFSDDQVNKIRRCRSGPQGGDVQIAAAVVKQICHKVIFLQDPFTSHPHETDIRLFEQTILLFEQVSLIEPLKLELATNIPSAGVILGVHRQSKDKSKVPIRLDQDVVELFKSQGKDYQDRINAILRDYMTVPAKE